MTVLLIASQSTAGKRSGIGESPGMDTFLNLPPSIATIHVRFLRVVRHGLLGK